MDLRKYKGSCLSYNIIVLIPDINISPNMITIEEHLCSERGDHALILFHLPVLSYPHSSDKIVTWIPQIYKAYCLRYYIIVLMPHIMI